MIETHASVIGGARQRSRVAAVVATAGSATMETVTEFNVLESLLLVTCFGVLLGGAIFKSAAFDVGGVLYWALTVPMFTMLLLTMLTFIWMTVAEVRRAFAAASIREALVEKRKSRLQLAADRAMGVMRSQLATTLRVARSASQSALNGGGGAASGTAARVQFSENPASSAVFGTERWAQNPLARRASAAVLTRENGDRKGLDMG